MGITDFQSLAVEIMTKMNILTSLMGFLKHMVWIKAEDLCVSVTMFFQIGPTSLSFFISWWHTLLKSSLLRLCALIMLRNIDCVLQTEGVPFLILNGILTSTSIFFFKKQFHMKWIYFFMFPLSVFIYVCLSACKLQCATKKNKTNGINQP